MNLLQIVKATGDAFIARAVESVKTDAGTTVDSRVNLRTSEDRIAVCISVVKSRMPELGTYGSVGDIPSNRCFYPTI